jgi:hypothetical protein
MIKRHTYLEEDRDPDELRRMVANCKLPTTAIVTAEQLQMRPGQKLAEKARELGVTVVTLRLWHAEWKGSGYDPDYCIKRAGHDNWLRNKWSDKEWVVELQTQIAKGQHRHVGDLLMELGIPGVTCQAWSQRHASWEQALWHSGIPYPKLHWRDHIAWIRHGTIDRYRLLKAEKIASGMSVTEAMHEAADQAVDEIKHATRQRRRVERDTLLGIGGHEELLRRYRGDAKLTDAHSRRIAKKLTQVARWAAMERGLRETGVEEDEIERIMGELMGAFKESDEAGQQKWATIRKAVVRRRNEADAFAHAQKVGEEVVKRFVGDRRKTSPTVARLVEQRRNGRDKSSHA